MIFMTKISLMSENEKINTTLTRGVDTVLPSKDKLAEMMAKKKITLYQGFDPSMPNLHLGNLVGLMKLRQFQKLGHKVIFLVGDFTGMIGDPTDKSATRKKLTRDEVVNNSKEWKKQAGKVLDFDGDNPALMKFNSEWLDKVSFQDLIEIASNFTVQQLIERDMFQDRIKTGKPIHLHEFLYPVAQGYDCVQLNVDLEIGGSDQVFNMLAGRNLMKALKGKEKYVLTTKLVVDSQGDKVGKTTGNALFLNSKSEDFFGGIMSFSDNLIVAGFEMLTEVGLEGIEQKVKSDPMGEKKRLAFEVTKLLWGAGDAKKAQVHFEKTFQKKEPIYKPIKSVKPNTTLAKAIPIITGSSNSESKRKISQGAVDVNEKSITDPTYRVRVGDNIKVGTQVFNKIEK